MSTLPADSGIGFIFIPHLDPTRESHMVGLLAGASAVPVTAAVGGRRIRPNHVYVIPPNRLLAIRGGRMSLTSLRGPRAYTALDLALRSLAEDQGSNAVGIVLSGTGNHGTAGLEAIVKAGGLGLAQNPATALFDQMPRSAAAAGVPPSHVLAPEGMAAVLLAHARHLAQPDAASPRTSAPSTGRFFHDGNVLDALAANALPCLIDRATEAYPVRVWVPGCGTGEEAYSIAMLLLERLEAAGKGAAVKVFATDSDEEALKVARRGVYPQSSTETLSSERLDRFFHALASGQYQVWSELRWAVVFGRVDLFTDPPISKLDLLVYRAPLGNLRHEVIARLISRLHFALNPGGYLLLGHAMPAVTASGLFETVSEKASLYRNNGSAHHPYGRQHAVPMHEGDAAILRGLGTDTALQREIVHIAALEQQRIGQELHDGTQQELTGLGLLAQSLAEELQKRGAAEAGPARRLAAGIAEANRHVRALARGLVPAPVDADTLPHALGELARNTQETYKLSCRCDCPAPLEIAGAGTATHLYRIAQEAVGNAARHSKGDEILIRLAKNDGQLRLEIRDNGIGIAPQPATRGGVGLRLMERRCRAIGGRFLIEPRPGGGTIVSCTLQHPAGSP